MEPGKKATAFLLLFILTKATIGQLQSVYSFQKDDTILKRNYYQQSLKKKDGYLSAVTKENAADYKKIYDEQYELIKDLLTTSRSVTAPEPHGYLQSVLKKIVSANNELKGLDVRVVFSRDWWANAYSIGDGTIMINAGLMIYLNNEAELAFVLCHELSHYYLNHSGKSIKKYIETLHSEEFQKELKRLSKEQYRVNQQLEKLAKSMVFDSRSHSRNNEVEADLQAFSFLKRTGYDCHAIISSLEILDKIDDSSLYKPLDLEQMLNFSEYPFKKKWIQKESTIFSQLDENDTPLSQKEKDSLKTHPDCSKRILALNDSVQSIKTEGKGFLVDENLFNKLKKDFFTEMTEQCYRNDNLSRNLYYSLLMVQANENIPVAVYSVARCLNKIYENQKNHSLGEMISSEDRKYATDYNLLLRMLSRLRLDEITSLNYHFCKRYYEQMKGYPEFKEEIKKLQSQKISN
jgi:Zn-dependent protease with chaperone function